MIRTLGARSVRDTNNKRRRSEYPTMISRGSSDEWSGSSKIRADGTPNTVAASESDAVLTAVLFGFCGILKLEAHRMAAARRPRTVSDDGRYERPPGSVDGRPVMRTRPPRQESTNRCAENANDATANQRGELGYSGVVTNILLSLCEAASEGAEPRVGDPAVGVSAVLALRGRAQGYATCADVRVRNTETRSGQRPGLNPASKDVPLWRVGLGAERSLDIALRRKS